MRVLFSSTRGDGHFRPLIPLIEACLRQGHAALVTAPQDLAKEVAALGAEFFAFDHPGDDVLRPVWQRISGLESAEANAAVVSEIFVQLDAGAALPLLRAAAQSWRPDVIVRESYEYAAALVGELLNIPVVRWAVSLAIVEEASDRWASPPLDELRRGVGLLPNPEALPRAPHFTFFPRTLEDPRSTLLDAQLRFRAAGSTEPAGALPLWSASTAPLVYVTLGSVAGAMPAARTAYRAALDALATLDVRGLLTVGQGLDRAALGAIPANVRVEAWVPQADVLAHAAAVVHHGGSGTLTGTLAAGLPMVVVPLFADQHANAARVAACGAGIALTDRPTTAEALRAALTRVLHDDAHRRVARGIQEEMRSHRSIDLAVDELERLVR